MLIFSDRNVNALSGYNYTLNPWGSQLSVLGEDGITSQHKLHSTQSFQTKWQNCNQFCVFNVISAPGIRWEFIPNKTYFLNANGSSQKACLLSRKYKKTKKKKRWKSHFLENSSRLHTGVLSTKAALCRGKLWTWLGQQGQYTAASQCWPPHPHNLDWFIRSKNH